MMHMYLHMAYIILLHTYTYTGIIQVTKSPLGGTIITLSMPRNEASVTTTEASLLGYIVATLPVREDQPRAKVVDGES